MTRAQAPMPIMTNDQERFMAFEGLVQWTQAVVAQSKKVSAARDCHQSVIRNSAAPQVGTTHGSADQHVETMRDPVAQQDEIMRQMEERRLRTMRDAEERRLGRVDEFAIEDRSGIPALNQA